MYAIHKKDIYDWELSPIVKVEDVTLLRRRKSIVASSTMVTLVWVRITALFTAETLTWEYLDQSSKI